MKLISALTISSVVGLSTLTGVQGIDETKEPKINEKQVECVAKNMYYEAGISTKEDQEAVAWVTMNRVRANRFPDTPCEVVFQITKKASGVRVAQFSWVFIANDHEPTNKELFEELKEMAGEIIYLASRNDHWAFDPTNGSDHYYQPDLISKPRWAEVEHVIHKQKIGAHIYLKLK